MTDVTDEPTSLFKPARLNSEINAAGATPEMAARIGHIGDEPSKSTGAEFTKLYRSDIERRNDVVVPAKVQVE
jgi:tripartite-type tricarboxylate transporter receptor subunit TctC